MGSADGPADQDFLIVRHRPDGGRDALFGNDGRLLIDLGGKETARAVTLDGQGRIIVVGETHSDEGGPLGNTDAVVLRILP